MPRFAHRSHGSAVAVVETPAAEGASLRPFFEGLTEASGPYVLRLDAGAELRPEAPERLASRLDADPDAVVAYPAYRVLGEEGTEVATVVPEELDRLEILRFQLVPAGPAAMFRREAALAAAGPPEEWEEVDELLFWLRLAGAGKLRRVAEPLASISQAAPSPLRGDGGLAAARRRIEHFERAVRELDLPEDAADVLRSAARSACVLAALELDPADPVGADRVCVADRFAISPRGEGEDLSAQIAELEAQASVLAQGANRQRAALAMLESALEEPPRSQRWRRMAMVLGARNRPAGEEDE